MVRSLRVSVCSEAQLVATVAALQKALERTRKEADGAISTTKYMQVNAGPRRLAVSCNSGVQMGVLSGSNV